MANDGVLFLAQIETIETKLLLAAAEQTQTDRFAVNRGNGRHAHVDILIVRLQIHAAILRQTPLRDVHVRHHFQARDDGRLQHAQLRRHGHFVQNSVDPITDAQIVLQRLDVNIGRALDNRFANDLVHKFHDGRFRIVGVQLGGGLRVLKRFEGAVRFQDFVERFRPDAVERFHRAQNLRARHQHPFGRFFQKLGCELPADRIEQIVGREHHRIFLHLDRQNVMLKNKPARQDRQCRAVDLLGVDRNDRHTKEIPDRVEEALLVHFAGIEDLAGPGSAV